MKDVVSFALVKDCQKLVKYSFELILQNLYHRKVQRGRLLQQSWIRCGSSPSALGSALSHQYTVESLRPVRDQEKLSNSILKRRFRLGKHVQDLKGPSDNDISRECLMGERGEWKELDMLHSWDNKTSQKCHIFFKKKVVESKSFLFGHTLPLLSMIRII